MSYYNEHLPFAPPDSAIITNLSEKTIGELPIGATSFLRRVDAIAPDIECSSLKQLTEIGDRCFQEAADYITQESGFLVRVVPHIYGIIHDEAGEIRRVAPRTTFDLPDALALIAVVHRIQTPRTSIQLHDHPELSRACQSYRKAPASQRLGEHRLNDFQPSQITFGLDTARPWLPPCLYAHDVDIAVARRAPVEAVR